MTAATLRQKHVKLDQRKLDRVRRALRARTATETLDRALDLRVTEADIDLPSRAGKGQASARPLKCAESSSTRTSTSIS